MLSTLRDPETLAKAVSGLFCYVVDIILDDDSEATDAEILDLISKPGGNDGKLAGVVAEARAARTAHGTIPE